jgi:hypothetical protein
VFVPPALDGSGSKGGGGGGGGTPVAAAPGAAGAPCRLFPAWMPWLFSVFATFLRQDMQGADDRVFAVCALYPALLRQLCEGAVDPEGERFFAHRLEAEAAQPTGAPRRWAAAAAAAGVVAGGGGRRAGGSRPPAGRRRRRRPCTRWARSARPRVAWGAGLGVGLGGRRGRGVGRPPGADGHALTACADSIAAFHRPWRATVRPRRPAAAPAAAAGWRARTPRPGRRPGPAAGGPRLGQQLLGLRRRPARAAGGAGREDPRRAAPLCSRRQPGRACDGAAGGRHLARARPGGAAHWRGPAAARGGRGARAGAGAGVRRRRVAARAAGAPPPAAPPGEAEPGLVPLALDGPDWDRDGLTVVLTLLTSCVRHASSPRIKLTCVALISRLSVHASDDARLERVAPYLGGAAHGHQPAARARTPCARSPWCWRRCATSRRPTRRSSPTCILPAVKHRLKHGCSDAIVQVACAERLPRLAATARRFLDLAHWRRAGGGGPKVAGRGSRRGGRQQHD